MKRLRLDRWSSQLLSPRARPRCSIQQVPSLATRRSQSSSAAQEFDFPVEDHVDEGRHMVSNYASPNPEDALGSAKLAALHARLSLPRRLPVQTLARTLVDPSADPDKQFNNLALSQIGTSFLAYYVAEWLLCHYPRLPMTVLFAASYAYNGPPTLSIIAREWGVDTAAFPGSEVDPGLLQFKKLDPGAPLPTTGPTTRPDRKSHYRRGISSRNVYDDEFGDLVAKDKGKIIDNPQPMDHAYANFVRSVVGALYLHAGRQQTKTFIQQHILSRQLAISSLFRFDDPVRELAKLCAREEFEYPVARILSETGRYSISPVFVVGIFSGKEKLGEGAASSLVEARVRASVAALKAWYLYSPGKDARVPSEMEVEGAKPWEPVHIDLGEIIH